MKRMGQGLWWQWLLAIGMRRRGRRTADGPNKRSWKSQCEEEEEGSCFAIR
jgi:hypothetical protein